VIRHIAPAAGLVYANTTCGEHVGRRHDVRPPAALPNAERQDMRMLEQEERVRNSVCPALVDERTLQLQRFAIWHPAKPTNVEWPQSYTWDGSKFSIPFLTSAMNWSATAPSTRRWS
jgi:hypothetical protein